MQLDNRNKFLILFILLGAVSRFFPHPLNFTPLAAMALFGGTYLMDKKWAFLIPIASIFISDIIFELYN